MSVLGKSTDPWGAADTARSVHAAIGISDASVRVFLVDDTGNLRPAASQGPGPARTRSSGRREAFSTGREVSVRLPDPGDRRLTSFPMAVQDEVVGVVDVTAPPALIEERRDTILALVRQSAALVKLTRERAASDRTLREIRLLSSLNAALMTATDPHQAMAAAATASWERTRVPVAVFDRSMRLAWRLGATRGLGPAKRSELERAVEAIPARIDDDTVASFATAAEAVMRRPVAAFGADPIVLVTQRRTGMSSGFLQRVVSVLAQVMRDEAGVWGDREGMGLAMAAHELKGSLVGARAALDQVLEGGASEDGERLLWRTRAELERLTQLVGPLLDWGAGRGLLRVEKADLVAVVDDAISSCLLGTSDTRVRLDASAPVPFRGDTGLLRTAIANLIRNALRYSPANEVVVVSVRADQEEATVTVLDRGPGLVSDELDVILDPFTRGRSGRAIPSGAGLGLFIARRVFEAHGAALRIQALETGASFSVTFPLGATIGSRQDADVGPPSVLSA